MFNHSFESSFAILCCIVLKSFYRKYFLKVILVNTTFKILADFALT